MTREGRSGGPIEGEERHGGLVIENDIWLGALTTLGLGGPARHLIVASDEGSVLEAVAWARRRNLDLLVLGGGSNLVVSDAGFDGLVLRVDVQGTRFETVETPGVEGRPRMLVHAAAGESWDTLVELAVGGELAGIECLAGIPGLVGATPIQNVGAYGQDVSETIVAVRALERSTGEIVTLSNQDCRFGYRDSVFKHQPGRYVILGVTFSLRPEGIIPSPSPSPSPSRGGGGGGREPPRYRELAAYLQHSARKDAGGDTGELVHSLAEVSRAVRALRRSKSMLMDRADPNHRSVGSFFMNPVIPAAAAASLVSRALAEGVVSDASQIPQFPAGPGWVKLSAAWLIERSGFHKGFRRGSVGLSSNHALALVHHGGGTTAELLALARDILHAVRVAFGLTLVPEPTLVGPGATLDG